MACHACFCLLRAANFRIVIAASFAFIDTSIVESSLFSSVPFLFLDPEFVRLHLGKNQYLRPDFTMCSHTEDHFLGEDAEALCILQRSCSPKVIGNQYLDFVASFDSFDMNYPSLNFESDSSFEMAVDIHKHYKVRTQHFHNFGETCIATAIQNNRKNASRDNSYFVDLNSLRSGNCSSCDYSF